MTAPREPALTADEWAHSLNGATIRRPGGDEADYVKIGRRICVEGIFDKDEESGSPFRDLDCGEVDFTNARHALAALALHGLKDASGRPLGFTREHVAWLHNCGRADDGYAELVDIIEALLPPEAK